VICVTLLGFTRLSHFLEHLQWISFAARRQPIRSKRPHLDMLYTKLAPKANP